MPVVLLGIHSSAREVEEMSSCWEAGETSNCYILLPAVGVVLPNNLLLDEEAGGCRYLRMTAGAAVEEGSNRGWLWISRILAAVVDTTKLNSRHLPGGGVGTFSSFFLSDPISRSRSLERSSVNFLKKDIMARW